MAKVAVDGLSRETYSGHPNRPRKAEPKRKQQRKDMQLYDASTPKSGRGSVSFLPPFFFRAHRTNDLTEKLEKVGPFECDILRIFVYIKSRPRPRRNLCVPL